MHSIRIPPDRIQSRIPIFKTSHFRNIIDNIDLRNGHEVLTYGHIDIDIDVDVDVHVDENRAWRRKRKKVESVEGRRRVKKMAQ